VRMGPVAFGAERDRLLRSRGGRGANGNGNGNGHARPTASPPAAPAVAVIEVAAEPDLADEAPAPADARPLRASPQGAGLIEIGFGSGVALDRLLPAIESVTQAIRGRPGPLPVVINIPVAGATRQVRLRDHAEWDDRLAETVRRAAGLPVEVELRPVPAEA